MKIKTIFAIIGMAAAFAACGNSASKQMTGAYSEAMELTAEDDSLFRAVVTPYDSTFVPVKVSRQVVAGTNYRFICQDKKGADREIVVFQPLPGEGDARIVSIDDKEYIEPDSTGYIVRVGMQVPDITWTQADGKTVSIKDLRGKVVMLQFTASWCGVCRKEMPFIERDIWQKHKDNKDFYLVGIDRDEPLETVKQFAEKTGVTYPLALDPGADLFAEFALRESGITRNVLVDRDGKIVMMTRLYNEEEFARLVEKIDSMLK